MVLTAEVVFFVFFCPDHTKLAHNGVPEGDFRKSILEAIQWEIMTTRIINLWNKIRSSLWFIPTLMTASVMVLAFLTFFVDQYSALGQWFSDQRFAIGPQGARTLLATVAGSVIGVAGVSFSITIVALTLASSQFGPRLLNNFMKDLTNQMILGTFIATFIYCLLVLGSIRENKGEVFVPQISILVGILLTLMSLGVFIYFIHHISISIHAEKVITAVSKDLKKTINHLFPQKRGQGKTEGGPASESTIPPNFEREAQLVLSPASGYLQAIDQQGIMDLAIGQDLLIHLKYRPGAFIVAGEILASVWPPQNIEDAHLKKIAHTFLIGSQRTEEQDVEFSIHLLVELAVRALSPGINDPFSAIGCIDRLGECLSLLAGRTLPSPYCYDDTHQLRVIINPITMEGIFNAAFNQIRQNGGACVAVGLRLLETFGVLVSTTDNPTVYEAVRHHAKMVKEEMLRHLKEGGDLQEVETRYRDIQKLLPIK